VNFLKDGKGKFLVHAMKAFMVLGGLAPPILIAALEVGEWST